MMQVCWLILAYCVTSISMPSAWLDNHFVFTGILPTPFVYTFNVHLNGALTPQMEAYNSAMSRVRTSVEWLFGDIISYFEFLDFKKNLKLGLSSVGKMYIVSAILRNGLTCLYGNTTSDFFLCDPPDLETYFA